MGKKKKKKKNLNIDKKIDKKEEDTQVQPKSEDSFSFQKIIKIIVLIFVAGALFYALAYISYKEPVIIGVANWESAEVTALYLQENIASEFNVSVQLKNNKDGSGINNMEIYENIASGKFDIHPETRVPLHDDIIDEYNGRVIKGTSSYNARNSLCMIRRVAEKYNIDEVADLSNKMDKAVMWLGEEGWELTNNNKKIAEEKGYLDKFDLKIWDENEALEKIKEYEKSEKPFIFACYEPSRITEDNYDLVVLKNDDDEDEKNMSIHISYSKFLQDKYPEIIDYINQLDLNVDTVNQLLIDKKSKD